jgi:parallel beta-helix repeat protein
MVIFALLLCGLLRPGHDICSRAAVGTIYIRPDGSIEPSTAPISSINNVTYVLTGVINDSIVVERDNIILDGKGYILHGGGNETGLFLTGRSNVTLENIIVDNFEYGVHLQACSNITIFNSTIRNSLLDGVYLVYSVYTVLYGNTISSNGRYGIELSESGSNRIIHNNIVQNTKNNTYVYNSLGNVWDDDYPSGGNYWSDLTSMDMYGGSFQNLTGSDGINDAHRAIDANNQDNYPLFAPINVFDAGTWNDATHRIEIVSNSSVSDFQLNPTQKTVSFNVTSQTNLGFCRISIPNLIVQNMWQNNITVLVDGNVQSSVSNWTDSGHTYVYFTYPPQEHEIVVIPEFQLEAMLALLLISAFVTLSRRRGEKVPKK